MGLFNNKQSGHRCEVDDSGVTHCQIYEKDKTGKMATGTDISFTIDPQTCDATMVGNHDINDADQGKVDRIIGARQKSCRKGLWIGLFGG